MGNARAPRLTVQKHKKNNLDWETPPLSTVGFIVESLERPSVTRSSPFLGAPVRRPALVVSAVGLGLELEGRARS